MQPLEYENEFISVQSISDVEKFADLPYQHGVIGYSLNDTVSTRIVEIVAPKVMEVFPTRTIILRPENKVVIEDLVTQGLNADDKAIVKTFKHFARERNVGSELLDVVRKQYNAIKVGKINKKVKKLIDEIYGDPDLVRALMPENTNEDLAVAAQAETLITRIEAEALLSSEKKKASKKKRADATLAAVNLEKDFGLNLEEEFDGLNLDTNPIGNFKISVIDDPHNSAFKGYTKRAIKAKDNQVDLYETQREDVEILTPLLSNVKIIYEPCAGNGAIVKVFEDCGLEVVYSDLNFGDKKADFLNNQAHPEFDVLITNPPYAKKWLFLEQAYKLNKRFALLLPLECVSQRKCQDLFKTYGVSVGIVNPRPKFLRDGKLCDPCISGCAWFFGGPWEFVNQNPKSSEMFYFFFLEKNGVEEIENDNEDL